MKEVLEKVLAQFKEDGIDGHIENVDGTDTLRLIPTNLGPDGDSTVVMEMCRIPMEDEDDIYYIQLYTTIAVGLEEKDYPNILVKLNDINLPMLMGYYGILAESGMIYHKAIMRLPAMSDDDMAKHLTGTAYDCFAVIDFTFQQLKDIFA